MTETERAITIIEARLSLYTDIGQINALRECISSIRSAAEARATAAEATVTALQEALKVAEAQLDHYKAMTANRIGFTYEPTGERVTIFAASNRSFEILIANPSILEFLAVPGTPLDFGDATRSTSEINP